MKNFPQHHKQLKELIKKLGKEIPETMSGFQQLHRASIGNGTLSSKTKELIALGIGITARCNGCIAFHVYDALKAGASREEIMETIGVAVLMGGGPSLMYGCEALEALEQFQEEVALSQS